MFQWAKTLFQNWKAAQEAETEKKREAVRKALRREWTEE